MPSGPGALERTRPNMHSMSSSMGHRELLDDEAIAVNSIILGDEVVDAAERSVIPKELPEPGAGQKITTGKLKLAGA